MFYSRCGKCRQLDNWTILFFFNALKLFLKKGHVIALPNFVIWTVIRSSRWCCHLGHVFV